MTENNVVLEVENPSPPKEIRPRLSLNASIRDAQCNIKEMKCLSLSMQKYVVFLVLSVVLFFIPYLLYRWFLCIRLMVFNPSSFESSKTTHILVTTKDFDWEIRPLVRTDLPDRSQFIVSPSDPFQWWEFQCCRYYYDARNNEACELHFDYDKTFQELHDCFQNYTLNMALHERHKLVYGPNKIDVSLRFLFKMMSNELLNPFYLFQILSITFWFYEGYIIYSSVVVGLTVLSTGTSIIDMIRVMKNLRRENEIMPPVLAKLSNVPDHILIENTSVVPGMLCKIARPQMIGFDCVLIAGKCHVKETSVTGDTLLKLKTPLPLASEGNARYDILQHREHTIYGGSFIEEVNAPCEVMALNTGFSTVQGKLIRNMLYPQKDKFVQYEDAVWFAMFLALISIAGFWICVPTFMSQKVTLRVLIENFFDMITVAVPPILPAAMSIGTSMAIQRLRMAGIYCVSPAKVAVAGKITALCIDARGTLVDQDAAFVGYRLVRVPELADNHAGLLPMFGKYNTRTETISTYFSVSTDTPSLNKSMKAVFANALATCHQLTLHNGEIMGTREDAELFASTGSVLAEDENNKLVVRMSQGHVVATQVRKNYNEKKGLLGVVVKYAESGDVWAYARASTMSLGEVCKNDNVPNYWKELMGNYERDCNLAFGICAKKIDDRAAGGEWADLLKDMDVVGIVVLKLMMREGAISMIQSLKKAKIPCIMLSSENPTTSIAIAKAAGIIEPRETIVFSKPSKGAEREPSVQWVKIDASEDMEKQPKMALDEIDLYLGQHDSAVYGELISGDQLLQEDTKNVAIVCDKEAARFVLAQRIPINSLRLIKQTRVFAGLRRDGLAVELICKLSRCGESVMMVGSSFSEYGALSKSDVGVLLSPAKQLCVFAALTCSKSDDSGIPLIISEGRAALVTSYECFKWMAMSSIIQFSVTTILYYYSMCMTDEQYLYTDLFLVLPLAFTMSWSRPSRTLTPEQPHSSLLSLPVLASVAGQMVIQILAQVRAKSEDVGYNFHDAYEQRRFLPLDQK